MLKKYLTGLMVLLPSLLLAVACGNHSAFGPEVTSASVEQIRGNMPGRGMVSERPARHWQEALVSGNGRQGAMLFGTPNERVILNHHLFNQPQSSRPLAPPSMSGYLEHTRELIAQGDAVAAQRYWVEGMREQGFPIALELWQRLSDPEIIWTDAFHPGYALDIHSGPEGEVVDYLRSTDFASGELKVQWRDDRGLWLSRLFVSRADDVVVQEIIPPPGAVLRISADTELEGLASKNRKAWPELEGDYRARFDIGYGLEQGIGMLSVRGHYNPQRSPRGFEGLTRISTGDGEIQTRGDALAVAGASSILMLTRLSRLEDYQSSQLPATAVALADLVANTTGKNAYTKLLSRHVAIHGAAYQRVHLKLDSGDERYLSSEALLRLQKERSSSSHYLNPALTEKMFDMGRYVMLSSSGDWPPRLSGLWTGSWQPEWQGDFTLDANLNLAVSGANIGALPETMQGYVRLIDAIKGDWAINASQLYGARGLLAGTRTDGEHNLHTHHSVAFPGHFWLGGAQWLTQPLYEYYEVSGDRQFLQDEVVPLLKGIVLFFEDFLQQRDADGKYVFNPSYSPENIPGNRGEAAAINATMDVAAAREALVFLIRASETLGIEADNIPRWRAMLEAMPPYLVNSDGALKEWAHPDFSDNYNHRHSSHLYPLWPGHEINPEQTPELFRAAGTAASLRRPGNESAHGLMHMGLIAARLKDADIVARNLAYFLEHDYIFPSLVTSHNPDLEIYNVDASTSMPSILMEALLYSRPGVIELLPALPESLHSGSIEGMLARGQIRVASLAWGDSGDSVEATLVASRDQEVQLIYRRGMGELTVDGQRVAAPRGDRVMLALKKHRPLILSIKSADGER